MSIKKSIIKNGIAASFQKILKIGEQLFLIPFFIKFWGPAYYGEWLTLTVVPAFIALSDFGFGSATANTFLLKYASGDKQGAANTSATGIRVLTFLIFGSILFSLLLIFVLDYFKVFDNSLINSRDAMLAIILLLVSKIIGFYQQIFEAYFRAARKASISINLVSCISGFNILMGIIVLLTGGKVVAYAGISLIISLILYPVYVYIAKKTLNLTAECKGTIIKSEIKELINKGFGFFLAPIWQAIYFQGCTFAVRIILGPIAVTAFNTVRTVIRSSSQGFAMTIMATYPDFQFEMGAGNFAKAKKIYYGVLGMNMTLAIVFTIGLMLFGNNLYAIWTQKTLEVSSSVWLVFISSIVFYAIWFTFSFIFEALNKPFTYTVASLVCASFSVISCFYLSSIFGLLGAAVSNLLFDVLMCIYILPKGAKALQTSIKEIFFNSFTLTSQIFSPKVIIGKILKNR